MILLKWLIGLGLVGLLLLALAALLIAAFLWVASAPFSIFRALFGPESSAPP